MHKKNILISFIAGFLIGICAAMLTINIVNMHQRSLLGSPLGSPSASLSESLPGKLPDTEASLKKKDEPSQELQQTKSTANNLTAPKIAVPGEGIRNEDKALAAPERKDAAVPKSQDEIDLSGIKVYIHYARQKDKKMADAFSAFLKTKGYAFADAENIKHRHRDIRYFHSDDEKAALLLQKQFNNFIAGSAYAKKVNLNIRYLGKIYPRAQKGSLEVWVLF